MPQYKVQFEGTREEIKDAIVEAELNTSATADKRFTLPWKSQPVPQKYSIVIQGRRIPVIKKVRTDLGLGLKEAKELVDYVACCFEQTH